MIIMVFSIKGDCFVNFEIQNKISLLWKTELSKNTEVNYKNIS